MGQCCAPTDRKADSLDLSNKDASERTFKDKTFDDCGPSPFSDDLSSQLRIKPVGDYGKNETEIEDTE